MKVLCYPCKEASGVDTTATKLAPQTIDPEGCFHWVPICEGHADGWFEDPPDQEFPGPIVPLKVVRGKK